MSTKTDPVVAHDEESNFLTFFPEIAYGKPRNVVLIFFMKYVFQVEWYPIYGPKSLFKFAEKRPIVCYCTRE